MVLTTFGIIILPQFGIQLKFKELQNFWGLIEYQFELHYCFMSGPISLWSQAFVTHYSEMLQRVFIFIHTTGSTNLTLELTFEPDLMRLIFKSPLLHWVIHVNWIGMWHKHIDQQKNKIKYISHISH